MNSYSLHHSPPILSIHATVRDQTAISPTKKNPPDRPLNFNIARSSRWFSGFRFYHFFFSFFFFSVTFCNFVVSPTRKARNTTDKKRLMADTH